MVDYLVGLTIGLIVGIFLSDIVEKIEKYKKDKYKVGGSE